MKVYPESVILVVSLLFSIIAFFSCHEVPISEYQEELVFALAEKSDSDKLAAIRVLQSKMEEDLDKYLTPDGLWDIAHIQQTIITILLQMNEDPVEENNE